MKQKFRVFFVLFCLAVIFEGCWCRNCARGEEVAQSTLEESSSGVYVSSDLVVNATEYAEFERTVLEVANNNMEDLSRLLFVAISGSEPPSGTATAVLTDQKEFNSWFNPSYSQSFLNSSYWATTNKMLKNKRLPETQTLERALLLAPVNITDATKLIRFKNRISDLQNPPEDF